MKSIFLVTKNADFTEGRGPMLPMAVFEFEETAREFVMGLGDPYKGKLTETRSAYGDINYDGWYTIKPMRVFKDVEEYRDNSDEVLRASALKKLSMEERRVLGLAK